MKNKTNMFLAMLLVSTLFMSQGCKKDSDVRSAEKMFGINPINQIHFVVPVGFRGQIQITEDKTNGIIPSIKGKTVEIDVPINGYLSMKDWGFLFTEHQESASYADGTSIPDPNLASRDQEFPRDEVDFYTGGTEIGTAHPKETVAWFIGTKEELEKLK